jgi:uncharacterized protein with GYD domain
MKNKSASYAIIQYSPHPERYEFINVGVVVFDYEYRKIHRKVSKDFTRAKKVFGGVQKAFLNMALDDFVNRIAYEFAHSNSSKELSNFLGKRANSLRVTPLLPTVGNDAAAELEKLYSELIAAPKSRKRSKRVSLLLKHAFSNHGVLELLDKKPETVQLERYGVEIKAHYGFQNGHYNLINAARFDDPEAGLAEAGKLGLEGRALAETLEKRLIVVGDFSDHTGGFYNAIRDDLKRSSTTLYRLDEIQKLSDVIRSSVH